MSNHSFRSIPQSRIASFDVYAVGLKKHHVSAILECNVSQARQNLRQIRRKGQKVSFTAWLLKHIAASLEIHKEAAAYIYNKRKLIIFNDIDISLVVEKIVNRKKVPIPLVIRQVQKSRPKLSRRKLKKPKCNS